MSNAASFEFRHLRRYLKPEEAIPSMPSLLQQVELLTQDLRDARNHPVDELDEEHEFAIIDPVDDEPDELDS